MSRPTLPTTAVPARTIFTGVLGVLASLAVVVVVQPSPLLSMLLLLPACALPMWWLEYLRNRKPKSLSLHTQRTTRRRQARLMGGLIFAAMMLASIQLQLQFNSTQIGSLPDLAFPLLIATVCWLIWVALFPPFTDRPDSIACLGSTTFALLQRRKPTSEAWQCLRGWLIKAFFLPLMLAWLYVWLAHADQELTIGQGWPSVFVIGMALLYALDTLFATIGYLSTQHVIDAHIRSTDATWLGWLSALVCYPPLSGVVLWKFLDYKDGIEWTHWLGTSWLAFAWGATILILTTVYTSATIAFGPRFSNLTNRGIITFGPFRWTKHPAYISKNLSWWLIAVPFVSTQGALDAILNCLALLGVNAIYWTRAKTEERHLMRDPEYQKYAAWISEHGLFARCLNFFGLRPART